MENLKSWYQEENIPTLILFLTVCIVGIGILDKNFVLTSEVIYQDPVERYSGLMSEGQLADLAKKSNLTFAFYYPIYYVMQIISIFFTQSLYSPLLHRPNTCPKFL